MSKPVRKVLEVTSSFMESLGGYDLAVVEISKGYAIRLLARINMLKKMQKIDSNLYEMYFWDTSASYYDAEKVEDPGKAIPETEELPTECDQCVVREKEVQWCAYPNHSEGVELRTSHVSASEIEKIAKG